MKKGNFITAGAFSALAIFVIWASSSFPGSKGNVPGPAVYPTAVAVLMLMAALSLVITTIRMTPEEDKKLNLLGTDNVRVYVTMGILVVYVGLVQLVGFCAMSALLLFGLIKWYGRYRFHVCALSSVVITGIIYFVFSHVLHVPFRFGFLM